MGYKLEQDLLEASALRGIRMEGAREALHQQKLVGRRRSEIPERVPASREWKAREALRAALTARPVDAIRAARIQEELRRISIQNREHIRLRQEINKLVEASRVVFVKAARKCLDEALSEVARELDVLVAAAPSYALEFPEALPDSVPALVQHGDWIHRQICEAVPLFDERKGAAYSAPLLSRVRPEFRDAIAVRSRIGRGPAVPAGWARAAV
jgi:hypothetical protein